MLDDPVTTLHSIGTARAAALGRMGVCSLRDLMYLAPRDYRDFSVGTKIAELTHGELSAVRAVVLDTPRLVRAPGSLRLVTLTAQDETGRMQVVWFNQPYRKNQLHAGETRVFCGRVDKSRGLKLLNPSVTEELPGVVPVYPLARGLRQQQVRDAAARALSAALPEIEETLPDSLLREHGLCSLGEALLQLHFPRDMKEAGQARRRLAFEDMLCYLLAVNLLKQARLSREGVAFQTGNLLERFAAALPFPLTSAQRRVMAEIADDMASSRPMNRLVQGDVGSGKTVLAFFALYVAAKNGYQGALMAPTELLAQQHYALLRKLFGESVCLLKSGMTKKERAAAYARIETGGARIAVGTHALLQEGVCFLNLGVVVTDEQHRFGVRQRAQLFNKGKKTPDALVMSATPIPRTLAMLLYGDLSLSVLDELPPGRKKVLTRLVPQERRPDMYRFMEKQVREGRQAYVVCPLVEASEELEAQSAQEVYAELCALLPSVRAALLHGRMAAAKKEETIGAFRAGALDVLVSTTVVEVGVDVPNAAVMVIENADRFGLAQLHQLRGRVGRGASQSFCFLLCGGGGEAAKKRLEIMCKTDDGFQIAQFDLDLRGPGEFLGTRQHGDALSSAQLAGSMEVLLEAQGAADKLAARGEQADTARVFARARSLYRERMREIADN